ncbi:MAG TPA: hypothetical protein VK886_14280 [Vicinamibacterales bacterium]|nr:hypothetical protein [Vicinamibacterales bacterium]
MIARNRAILLSLLVLFVPSSIALAQDAEPQYSPDGAWFAIATISGRTIPFMDIYTSDPTRHGRAGTVLCTLSTPAFQGPYGMTTATMGGHGNWIRVAKNQFAFTVWRILIDADPSNAVPDGAPVGSAKFWGTITATDPNTFEGIMQAEYYGPNGVAFLTVPQFQTAGNRIVVQVDQPE